MTVTELRAECYRTPSASAPAGRWSFIAQMAAVLGERALPYRLQLDVLTAKRRQVARGEELFGQGDSLAALYEVRAGWFKTCMSDSNGRCQVTGFQMCGDLLGLDAIGGGRHHAGVVALDDALVCVIPYVSLNELLFVHHGLQLEFQRTMSREILRDQWMMLQLGTMTAERRIAAFVLDLASRQYDRGYSSSELVLRMTRDEIGSYLGLQLETVSRSLSKLQVDGVLTIRHRILQVLDEAALRSLVHGPA